MFSRLSFAAVLVAASTASAHINVTTGPAPAGRSIKIGFGVTHGCEDTAGGHYDTAKIRIDIPTGFTSVRPEPLPGFRISVIKTNNVVTAVEWTKTSNADILDGDDAYYEPTIRVAVPNTPYTNHRVTIHQTCRVGNADQTTVWTGDAGETPGARLVIVPFRLNGTGWHKFTIPAGVTLADAAALGTYFSDAQIVWKGTAAFSSNTLVKDQIAATAGTTALTSLAAGDEVWARY